VLIYSIALQVPHVRNCAGPANAEVLLGCVGTSPHHSASDVHVCMCVCYHWTICAHAAVLHVATFVRLRCALCACVSVYVCMCVPQLFV
jgi:hypothetical protein